MKRLRVGGGQGSTLVSGTDLERRYRKFCSDKKLPLCEAAVANLPKMLSLPLDRVSAQMLGPISVLLRRGTELEFISISLEKSSKDKPNRALEDGQSTQKFGKSISEAVGLHPLTVIDLHGLVFPASVWKSMAKSLSEKKNSTLSRLFITSCELSDEAAGAIFRALAVNDSSALKQVSLSDNNLTNSVTQSLCKWIKSEGTKRDTIAWEQGLRGRDMEKNVVDDEPRGNFGLSLSLSQNGLADDAATSIAEVLIEDRWIECFDLSRNAIGVNGVKAVVDVLRDGNETLSLLNLSGNPGIRELQLSFSKMRSKDSFSREEWADSLGVVGMESVFGMDHCVFRRKGDVSEENALRQNIALSRISGQLSQLLQDKESIGDVEVGWEEEDDYRAKDGKVRETPEMVERSDKGTPREVLQAWNDDDQRSAVSGTYAEQSATLLQRLATIDAVAGEDELLEIVEKTLSALNCFVGELEDREAKERHTKRKMIDDSSEEQVDEVVATKKKKKRRDAASSKKVQRRRKK